MGRGGGWRWKVGNLPRLTTKGTLRLCSGQAPLHEGRPKTLRPSCPWWLIGFTSSRHRRKAPFVVMMARALHAPLPLERDQGPSPGSVAEPLSFVADRDLHRRENDADRLSGVLGVRVAGAGESLALSQVDERHGALCAPQAEEFVGGRPTRLCQPPLLRRERCLPLCPCPRRATASQHHGWRRFPGSPCCRGCQKSLPARPPNRSCGCR